MKIYDMTVQMTKAEFATMVSEWINATYEPCVANQFTFDTTNNVEFDISEGNLYIHLTRENT